MPLTGAAGLSSLAPRKRELVTLDRLEASVAAGQSGPVITLSGARWS